MLQCSDAPAARLAALYGVCGRPVRVGGDDVAADDDGDLARPLLLAVPAHWEKFPEAWFNANYGVYFANIAARRLRGRGS